MTDLASYLNYFANRSANPAGDLIGGLILIFGIACCASAIWAQCRLRRDDGEEPLADAAGDEWTAQVHNGGEA